MTHPAPRFEFLDPDGDGLVLLPWPAGGPGPVVGLIATPRKGKSVGVFIPLDRVEEVVAGLRDMARQAGGQPAPGPCTCGHRKDEHVTVSGRLLCDSCDPDDTTRPTCTGYDALAAQTEGRKS